MRADEQWRTRIAERMAAAYSANPNAAAVFLGGSTARGQADRYSDLEVGVLWHADPTESERAAAIAVAGGEIHLLYAPEGIFWDDCLFMGHDDFGTPKSGQTVELVMNLLSGIADGVPLHGTDLLTGYRDAVSTLPPAHAAAALHSLVLETYDLVEEHVPELEPGEVDRWRHHFHYRRPLWETAPPRP